MATWRQFADAEPEMAALARSLLDWIPIMYLATVRRDGAPRVHPVCPVFAGDEMCIAVAGGGRAEPLRREHFRSEHDGRFALPACPRKARR